MFIFCVFSEHIESLWQPLNCCSRVFLLYKNWFWIQGNVLSTIPPHCHTGEAHEEPTQPGCAVPEPGTTTQTHTDDTHDPINDTLGPRRRCPPCHFLQGDKPDSPNPAPTPAQAVWPVHGLGPESPDGPCCPSALAAWEGSEFIDIDAELNWDRDKDEDKDEPQEHPIPIPWAHQTDRRQNSLNTRASTSDLLTPENTLNNQSTKDVNHFFEKIHKVLSMCNICRSVNTPPLSAFLILTIVLQKAERGPTRAIYPEVYLQQW